MDHFFPQLEALFYFVLIRGTDLSDQWLRKGLPATGTAMAQVLDALSTVMAWALDRVGMEEQGSHWGGLLEAHQNDMQ